MVATKEFGAGTNKQLWKDPAKRYKDKKATRMTDPLEPTFVQDDYPDCRVKRTHRGDLEIDCMVPERGYSEKWHWNGNHQIDYEDGSQGVGVTGTKVTKNKQGENHTTQYAQDHAVYNHMRNEVGNDGNQKELTTKGGAFSMASAGDDAYFTAGISTRVTGGAAQGGFHGAHYATNVDVGLAGGKKGGIGQGVSAKGKLLSTRRIDNTGRQVIQIMPPPNSDTGGVVTLQYKPDGTIMITTDSTHTTINGDTHTIKSKTKIVLEAPVIELKGATTISQGSSPTLTVKGETRTTGTIRSGGGPQSESTRIMADSLTFTTTSTGNGHIFLVEDPGSSLQTGDIFTAAIEQANDDADEWEISNCTYLTGGEVSRDQVLSSSANNISINFSSGTKNITLQLPPEKEIRNSTTVYVTNNAIGINLRPTMPLHIESADAEILQYDNSLPISDARPAWMTGPSAENWRVSSTNSTASPLPNEVIRLSLTPAGVLNVNGSVAVGANVVLNATAILVGNSTAYSNITTGTIKLANSTVNTGIAIPTSVQYTGSYFLHANGTWAPLAGAAGAAGGANTQVQFNDSTSIGASAGFTFNKSTNNVVIANTLSVGNASVTNLLVASGGSLNFAGGGVTIDHNSGDDTLVLSGGKLCLNFNALQIRGSGDNNHQIIYINGVIDGPEITGFNGVAFATNVGSHSVRAYISDVGMVIGNPTGGTNGSGTLNAQAVYDDDVLLTSMPMSTTFQETGTFSVEEWEDKNERYDTRLEHKTARYFKQMVDEGFDPRDPKQYFKRCKQDQVLPGMPTEEEWKSRNGKISLGELHTRHWLAMDMMGLILMKQQEQIEKLEKKINEPR